MNSLPSLHSITQKIQQLQAAAEEVRQLQDELIDIANAPSSTHKMALEALRKAVTEGLKKGEGIEASIALIPIIEVLAELEGPHVCDLLIDICGSADPEVGVAAANALQDLAFDRFKEVAQAAERACTRLDPSHRALRALPFVFTEITEPGPVRVLQKFLAHKDAEVTAAAIEALALLGDPAAVPLLQPLTKDARTVQMPEGQESNSIEQISIGMLAQQALELFEENGNKT